MIQNNKYYNYKTSFSVIMTLLFLWLLVSDATPIKSMRNFLENSVVSYHSVLTANKSLDNSDLTIVYIDQQSLSQYGPWPWSGRQFTVLLNRLINHGASVIAFDLPLPMLDQNNALQVYTWLKKTQAISRRTTRALRRAMKHFDYDGQLAQRLKQQLRQQNVILGFSFTQKKVVSKGFLPTPLNFKNKISLRSVPKTSSYNGNTLKIQNAQLVGGFYNVNRVQKNLLYKTPLLFRYGGHIYSSLSLQIARNRLLSNNIFLRTANDDTDFITGINLDETWIPTDKQGNIAFQLKGPPGSFPTVSAASIISGKLPPSVIESKIRDKSIIISSNIPHIRPGVIIAGKHLYTSAEIQANIVNSILLNQIFSEPRYLKNLDTWLLVFTGLVLSLILPGMNPRQIILIAGMFITSWLIYHSSLISSALYISTLIVPTLLIILLALFHYLTSRDTIKLKILSLLRMVQDKIPLISPGNSNQSYKEPISQEQSTVMFVDIRNFSRLAEQLNTVELNKLLGIFSTPISSVIMQHKGQINQHIGYSILATWSNRSNLSETMNHAIDAALKILSITKALQATIAKKNLPVLEINIGISCGAIKTRSLTWQSRLTCGHAVDSACKLSNLCEFYGVNIIASESSRHASPDFYYRQLDTIKITGVAKPISLYEPICRTADIDLCDYYELQLFERAMEYIRETNRKHAISFFSYLHRARPNIVVYKRYLDELQTNTLESKELEHNFLNKRIIT